MNKARAAGILILSLLSLLFDGCSYSKGCKSNDDCEPGELCTVDGDCISDCVPECGVRECGPDPVCKVSCGECEGIDVCNSSGECEKAPGPRISIDLSLRNLCNYGVSAESETRCESTGDCSGIQVCWESPQSHLNKGFCRDCETDAQCPIGKGCDHGWCHIPCTEATQSQDCQANEYCTGGFCRRPYTEGTLFSISNSGTEDLEIYLNQTKLYGNQDACAFSRIAWEPDQPTVVLAPNSSILYLSTMFTPPDIGEFRGFLEVHSNSIIYNPLLIFMCGQAVESVCNHQEDFSCPDCASCEESDFEEIINQKPEPNCSAFFD